MFFALPKHGLAVIAINSNPVQTQENQVLSNSAGVFLVERSAQKFSENDGNAGWVVLPNFLRHLEADDMLRFFDDRSSEGAGNVP